MEALHLRLRPDQADRAQKAEALDAVFDAQNHPPYPAAARKYADAKNPLNEPAQPRADAGSKVRQAVCGDDVVDGH